MSEQNGIPAADDDNKKDDKKNKKKKSKREGRKDKKKRKSGKRRKRGSSSTTSDSDDSDSSSNSNESVKKGDNDQADTKNSIRVQMRNLLKDAPSKNDEKTGKWTMVSSKQGKPIPPPAPSISQHSAKENNSGKTDKIIGQWSNVESIISQEEKRILENLKGRLNSKKSQQPPEIPEKPSSSSRKTEVKERVRDRSRNRSRERSRGDKTYRGRRTRSRSRSRSRTRYRRYSRSRSGSRGRRRVERPIVTFPAEPRLPPTREDKKLPARSYVMSKKEDTSSNAKKVMPMIGKMPVFKKQLSDKKSEEAVEEKVEEAPIVAEVPEEKKKPRDDTWDDYMPDPLQYSALMGAPPPPPRVEQEPEVVPPGLDPEEDSEFIPQPISDAPIARKGPLPKDFQETLDLLYDGDTPKPVVMEPKFVPEVIPVEPLPMLPDQDGPQMIMAEDLSQHGALLYGGFYQQNDDEQEETSAPDSNNDIESRDNRGNEDANGDVELIATEDSMKDQQLNMEELAMLGIDVDDVGSGMW